jgi:hypothetical protein
MKPFRRNIHHSAFIPSYVYSTFITWGQYGSSFFDTITDGIDDVVDTLGDLMKKMAMPLMIIGGGLLVFMLIKK